MGDLLDNIIIGSVITGIVGAMFAVLGWSIRKNIDLMQKWYNSKLRKVVDDVKNTYDANISTLNDTKNAVRDVDRDLKILAKEFGEHVIQDQAAFDLIKRELERSKTDFDEIKCWVKEINETARKTSESVTILVTRDKDRHGDNKNV